MSFFTKQRTAMSSISIVDDIVDYISINALPLTRQICNLAKEGRYLDIIKFEIDYTWAFTTDDFIMARQVQAFYSKADYIELGVDKEVVAYARFCESEEMCRDANVRLSNLSDSLDWDVNAVLYYAGENISRILGPVPALDDLNFSFGPGASTSTKGAIASARSKLSGSLECSMEMISSLGVVLEQFPLLCDAHDVLHRTGELDPLDKRIATSGLDTWTVPVTIVPGKLSFVPKTALTHRSIVVEPVLNGLVQKGIGSYLKSLLLKQGIDLSDQTRNQRLAREGSIRDNLATVDLSMASDCVARELVWSLLPFEWASFLDTYRTGVVEYKGIITRLEKFSSMGNAFTFELESLLFFAITKAVCRHLKVSGNVSVYGDDIICPVQAYDLLEKVLTFCGFKFNKKKSFASGPFRESCGADYYQGIDIRPYYNEHVISERVLYVMHNWFMRHCEFKIASYILTFYINKELALYGPDGYGDGHLIGAWNPRKSRKLQRSGFDGGVFDTYRLNPVTIKKFLLPGDYVYPVYSIYVGPQGSPDCVLDCTSDGYDPKNPANMYTIRGSRSVTKISIYTLARSIFWTDSGC